MNKLFGFAFCIILFGSSCIHNKVRYIINDSEKIGQVNNYPNPSPIYLIKKKDILAIRIISSNNEVNGLFNAASGSSVSGSQGGSGSGFEVNDSGSIILPVVGELYVEGKTIKEIRELVSSKVLERINNADVTVSLASFYLTFLGEFSRQGKVPVAQDNINMVEAIALAGGISDFGNKKRVLVLRQSISGTQTFRINVTDRSLLVSDNYFLQPNDILIAEPMKNKSFQLGIRDYTMVMSTITSTVAMVFLVINLVKK